MLYCPQCGAAYREGISSCSDCHVLLVREQKHDMEQESVTRPGDPNKDPFTPLWKGDDSRLHAELCSLLDEAQIPHITLRKEDRLFRATTQPFFELAIPFSQMEKAETAIHDAHGEIPELPDPDAPLNGESSGQPDGTGKFVRNWAQKGLLPAILEKLREPLPAPDEARHGTMDPDDWFSEDATVEVWSGQDETLGEMISASLLENDIHSRAEEFKDSRLVFVQPKDESRAREIVREILEASPPE